MQRTFSSIQRPAILDGLASRRLDLLVVGGGITGAGIALDAQARGLRVGLIEMQDFAAGTSSRSTKLVHGGLRYLKQLQIGLVSEVGKERAIVYENAPHVTTPTWMLLPIVSGGTFNEITIRAGLLVYDRLARVRRHERHTILSKAQALRKEPLLREHGLKSAGYYVEYRTDDARLTLEVLKEATRRGARVLNYAKAAGFLYDDGRVCGVRAEDELTGTSTDIHARKVVNAAGPWVDELRAQDASLNRERLKLQKGVHLTVDGARLPLDDAVYFDAPDGRMVFAIPRESKTYIGTTDTDSPVDLIHPRMNSDERDYLLGAVNAMFPDAELGPRDVESSWAGYRPLIHEEGKAPAEVSRKDELFTSDSGLISIAGGKLTGYRKMAERAVDAVTADLGGVGSDRRFFGLGGRKAPSTRRIRLAGGDVGGSAGFDRYTEEATRDGVRAGLDAHAASELARRYGSDVYALLAILRTRAGEAARHGLSPQVFAMLTYAIEEEMAATPADFFVRRSGALFFHIDWVRRWRTPVVDTMAQRLGWGREETDRHTRELDRLVDEASHTVPA